MSTPGAIMDRLGEIEKDLATRSTELESAATAWFTAKREREKNLALAFMAAEGSVAERHAKADEQHATDGAEAEGKWEGLRAVCRTLEARATIGAALLKAHTAYDGLASSR